MIKDRGMRIPLFTRVINFKSLDCDPLLVKKWAQKMSSNKVFI